MASDAHGLGPVEDMHLSAARRYRGTIDVLSHDEGRSVRIYEYVLPKKIMAIAAKR